MNSNYWEQCITEALSEAELEASSDQITIIAAMVEGASTVRGESTGEYTIPNPLLLENTELKTKLKQAQNKMLCDECNGGRVISFIGSAHTAVSTCATCSGYGVVDA